MPAHEAADEHEETDDRQRDAETDNQTSRKVFTYWLYRDIHTSTHTHTQQTGDCILGTQQTGDCFLGTHTHTQYHVETAIARPRAKFILTGSTEIYIQAHTHTHRKLVTAFWGHTHTDTKHSMMWRLR